MPVARFQFTLKRMLFGVAALCVIASFGLLPLRRAAQEASCQANLRTIALALQSYHSAYGYFPPAYTTAAAGNPMHSWRVLILPYAGEDALYRAYRFDEPWDGPNNSRLARRMPAFFACLAHARPSYTNYAVVVGPETAFPGPGSSSLSQVKDGTAVLVVEVKGGAIPWMQPRDLTMPAITEPDRERLMAALRHTDQDLLQQGLASRDHHSKGVNFLFIDQHVEPFGIYDGALLRSFLTIDGGEVFCIEKF
jgi:uncharacterized protein DUF1559